MIFLPIVQTSSWSDGQLVKHQRTFFNICLYQRLHKFTSDQLFCYFCTRDRPLEKWWAGRVIQKIHAKEGNWKKIMQTRSDEKTDNCNAAENFWAATLYSSVLSPSGIPIHLIISTIRTMDTILFPGRYILCAATSKGTNMNKNSCKLKKSHTPSQLANGIYVLWYFWL